MPRQPRLRSATEPARLAYTPFVDGSDWPRRLASPSLSQEELAYIVAEALLVRLPDHDIEATDEAAIVTTPGGDVLQARLVSIHSTLQRVPAEERLRHFEPFLRALLEMIGNLGKGARPMHRDRLVPLVRANEYFGHDPNGRVGATDACVEELVGGLMVVYAWASPHAFDVVTREEQRALKLSPAKLRGLAERNLRKRLSRVQHKRFGSIWGVATGGQLEPSLLLLEDFVADFAKEVEGDLIACVPSTETLLFSGTGVPGGAAELRRMAARLAGSNTATNPRLVLRWTAPERCWVEHGHHAVVN